jgi:hypothetical protein
MPTSQRPETVVVPADRAGAVVKFGGRTSTNSAVLVLSH